MNTSAFYALSFLVGVVLAAAIVFGDVPGEDIDPGGIINGAVFLPGGNMEMVKRVPSISGTIPTGLGQSRLAWHWHEACEAVKADLENRGL